MTKKISQLRILANGDILALDQDLDEIPDLKPNIFVMAALAAEKSGWNADGATIETFTCPGQRLIRDGEGWITQ